jgi:phosphate-selective porin
LIRTEEAEAAPEEATSEVEEVVKEEARTEVDTTTDPTTIDLTPRFQAISRLICRPRTRTTTSSR